MAKKKAGGRKRGTWDVTPEAFEEWRRGQKLSRARLAKVLGVSSTSVQNWGTGTAVPSARYQEAIARLMAEGVAGGAAVPAGDLEAAARDFGVALGRLVALALGGRS